jgi:hypothetical protein
VAATVVTGSGPAVVQQTAQAESQAPPSSQDGPPVTLAAEHDGVKLEVIVANRSGELPEAKEGDRTKLDFVLRITNLTGRALRFGRCRTTAASLRSTTHHILSEYAVHGTARKPTLADYPLVEPGQSVTLHAEWRDSRLWLDDCGGLRAGWSFAAVERGDYALMLAYTQRGRDVEVLGDEGATVTIPKEEVWHGVVRSPPIKVTLAGPSRESARSEGPKTSDFLGPEEQWPECRIVLEDVQPLFGGTAIYLDGAGPCVIRIVDRGNEKRFRIKLSPETTLALRNVCIEADLLTVAIQDRPGVPDEAKPAIVLRNAKGETFTLAKWANDRVPRFDKVYKALLDLRKKTEGTKPEYDGKWQREWKPPNPVR